jgi:hypothetical protein
VHWLDGERNLAFELWRLQFVAAAGECIAAVSTVVLAEEFVEWRSRTKGKVSEASPVKR